MAQAVSLSYVHPVLRGSDERLPDHWHNVVPMALTTVTSVSGPSTSTWDMFRHHAWASLLDYEPKGITHDVVFFNRFSDIVTGREQADGDDHGSDGFSTVRDLVRLDILIVVISPFDIANRLTRSVFGNLLDERESASSATWIYSHVNGVALKYLLDEPIYRRWFASPDAHPAPVAVPAPPASERPGSSPVPKSPYPARGGRT